MPLINVKYWRRTRLVRVFLAFFFSSGWARAAGRAGIAMTDAVEYDEHGLAIHDLKKLDVSKLNPLSPVVNPATPAFFKNSLSSS